MAFPLNSWRKFVVTVLACTIGATLWMPITAAHAAGYQRFTPPNVPGYCIRHAYLLGEISPCPTGNDLDFAFQQVPGLAAAGTISIESVNFPGWYLRHEYGRVKLAKLPAYTDPAYGLFIRDASFYRTRGLSGLANSVSYRSFNFPTHYLRHANHHLWISDQNSWNLDQDASFWVVYVP